MSTLPIAATQIITPYVLSDDEEADYLNTANNTNSTARRGGGRWSFAFSIWPLNIISDGLEVAALDVFLTTNPSFEVPVENIFPTELTGVVTVAGATAVGSLTVAISMADSGNVPLPGQYIKFSNKSKAYRVASYAVTTGNTGTITLTKPLRQALTTSHTMEYSGTDGKSNSFDGILVSFRNPNFGQPMYRVDGGITARFGPIQLYEAIS